MLGQPVDVEKASLSANRTCGRSTDWKNGELSPYRYFVVSWYVLGIPQRPVNTGFTTLKVSDVDGESEARFTDKETEAQRPRDGALGQGIPDSLPGWRASQSIPGWRLETSRVSRAQARRQGPLRGS